MHSQISTASWIYTWARSAPRARRLRSLTAAGPSRQRDQRTRFPKTAFQADVFTPTRKDGLDAGLERREDQRQNVIRVSGKVDEWTFFSKTWLSWELLRGAYTPLLGAHDRQESLLFAKKIERHALGASGSVG